MFTQWQASAVFKSPVDLRVVGMCLPVTEGVTTGAVDDLVRMVAIAFDRRVEWRPTAFVDT
jgi:hypothetical protein